MAMIINWNNRITASFYTAGLDYSAWQRTGPSGLRRYGAVCHQAFADLAKQARIAFTHKKACSHPG